MKRPSYVNPDTTRKDTSAILLFGLIALSALLVVALVSPWLPSLDGRPTLRVLLPILVAAAAIPLVGQLFVPRSEPEEEPEPLTEEEEWLRALVYGRAKE